MKNQQTKLIANLFLFVSFIAAPSPSPQYYSNHYPTTATMVSCKCGRMADVKMSHTKINPHRRFYTCPLLKKRCKFFEWMDPPTAPQPPSKKRKMTVEDSLDLGSSGSESEEYDVANDDLFGDDLSESVSDPSVKKAAIMPWKAPVLTMAPATTLTPATVAPATIQQVVVKEFPTNKQLRKGDSSTDTEALECGVCHDRIKRWLTNCGHSHCGACTVELRGEMCPTCRVKIESVQEMFG